jgi:hypothetical protein
VGPTYQWHTKWSPRVSDIVSDIMSTTLPTWTSKSSTPGSPLSPLCSLATRQWTWAGTHSARCGASTPPRWAKGALHPDERGGGAVTAAQAEHTSGSTRWRVARRVGTQAGARGGGQTGRHAGQAHGGVRGARVTRRRQRGGGTTRETRTRRKETGAGGFDQKIGTSCFRI